MVKKKVLHIEGMSCVNCEYRIEKQLSKTAGVLSASVSYPDKAAKISYDSDLISPLDIIKRIEELDYKVVEEAQQETGGNLFEIVVILFGGYLVLKHLGVFELFYNFPKAEEGMGYGILFLIGLLTSVHCIAMCGGINLSQCMPVVPKQEENRKKTAALLPAALYNLGRVISYTVVGGIVGALGSVFAFSETAKGGIQIAAGIFMILMGLNMFPAFSGLRKFVPRMPKAIATKIYRKKNSSNRPLYVGLLNGLMPCGPLQAMQLYALSTGSPFKGALSMLLFALGTIPLMFGLGALSSFLSRKFTGKVMMAGAVLVVILGLSMFGNGVSLSGISFSVIPQTETSGTEGEIVDGVQEVYTSLASGQYTPIEVQAGIPVRWTITAEEGTVNGCNGRIVIPEYGIEQTLQVGDNIIEFTPEDSGEYTYSCWMGMIRSTITVTE